MNATDAVGTGHSWQMTTRGKMPSAHNGMVRAAGTALDLLRNQAQVRRTPYGCPLPADLLPPVKMSA